MKMAEMAKEYKGEWLLIEYTRLDEHLHVKEGSVIVHSSSKNRIYEAQLRKKGKNLAIVYAGKLPEVAVMF